MTRPITIVGAASSIGIRPYDSGEQRALAATANVLREQGIVARLGARDDGDVAPPPYRDFVRRGMRPRNEEEVADYSRTLGRAVSSAGKDGAFVLLLGSDCSVVLGAALGARRPNAPTPGLVYIDAHADFAAPEESVTGSVASMCLSLIVWRGDSPLARLGGDSPLVRASDVALLGRRDHAEPWYGHAALETSDVLDLPHAAVRARGPDAIAHTALDRVAGDGGFWIHVDADVIDPTSVPAVDSPEPDGLQLDELAALLQPLVRHPGALGLELTIYDPALDPDRTSAAHLAALLERALR